MMNPIALGMLLIGVVLLLFGLFRVRQHRRVSGIAISLLGISAAAVPFLVSFYLAR
jgi:hypothetical protein